MQSECSRQAKRRRRSHDPAERIACQAQKTLRSFAHGGWQSAIFVALATASRSRETTLPRIGRLVRRHPRLNVSFVHSTFRAENQGSRAENAPATYDSDRLLSSCDICDQLRSTSFRCLAAFRIVASLTVSSPRSRNSLLTPSFRFFAEMAETPWGHKPALIPASLRVHDSIRPAASRDPRGPRRQPTPCTASLPLRR